VAASVKQIAAEIQTATVAAFCRLHTDDIEAAWEAIRGARAPRLLGSIPSSAEQIAVKLRSTPDAVIEAIDRCIGHMANYTGDVQFAAEDASRADRDFLVRAFNAAIAAGASAVCLSDAVGYMQAAEFGALVRYVRERIPDGVTLSVHCHNDLGLAVANTLEAVRNGATEVQVTVNGIGERAGNCSLEEVIVALRVRSDYYGATTRFRTEHIGELSELVAAAADMPVAKNKAIVGKHAFLLHEVKCSPAARSLEVVS
jgi:2-isopropylmalate synthase